MFHLFKSRLICEEAQINLPQTSHFHHALQLVFPSLLLSELDFHDFVSRPLPSLAPVQIPHQHTVFALQLSIHRLIGSHAVTPHHKRAIWMCAQPMNQEIHMGKSSHCTTTQVLISLETNSFTWETAHSASAIPRPTMFVWMRLG